MDLAIGIIIAVIAIVVAIVLASAIKIVPQGFSGVVTRLIAAKSSDSVQVRPAVSLNCRNDTLLSRARRRRSG